METKMVHFKVNGSMVEAPEGQTILKAVRSAGVKIPTLCHLAEVSSNASCGVCVVEVAGAKSLIRSCIGKVGEGMEIKTSSARVLKARKTAVELLLADHPKDCLSCLKNEVCELRGMSAELGIQRERFAPTRKKAMAIDLSSPSIARDPNKCILCGRCVAVCAETQGVKAIDFAGRGAKSRITTFMDRGLGKAACAACGQCVLVCPTGALMERDSTEAVFAAIANPAKKVLVQTAPAIRVGLGEAMGMGMGSLVTGKMVAGLRRLGFHKVFDTQFTADLTILEEGNELLQRVTKGGVLPMITSCSPGWIKFIEHFYPNELDHLSSCKSPQQMFGSVAKTYYAEKEGLDPRDVVVVSIMPCTAKKFEAARPEMTDAFDYWKERKGLKESERFYDVDYVLTTRELARMMRTAGVDMANLPDEAFDSPLGASTGAAVIFGATGGVMEAALRTVYEVLEKKPLPGIDFTPIRGQGGLKTAEVEAGGMKIKVAAANSLSEAKLIMDEIAAGKSPYAFIEIMSCPGGCLGGGGQPIPTNIETRTARAASIYAEDKGLPLRKSHDNPEVKALYEKFLGSPLGHLSHELLHTKYVKRSDI
jgi:iron-only hydrogenase group A